MGFLVGFCFCLVICAHGSRLTIFLIFLQIPGVNFQGHYSMFCNSDHIDFIPAISFIVCIFLQLKLLNYLFLKIVMVIAIYVLFIKKHSYSNCVKFGTVS